MQTVTTGAPSFADLAIEYSTDERCLELLESLRWPEGPRCPKCNSAKAWDIRKRKTYQCGQCKYQYSVTTGTVMHSTKLPIVKWVLAAALISNARKGVSSCQMARDLHVTQRTAWYRGMRLRKAMRETPWLQKFNGICELDESYLGGRNPGGKHGRGSENKQPVFGIRERGGRVHLEMVPDIKGATLKAVVQECVDSSAMLMADQLKSYNQLEAEFSMKRIDHSVAYVQGQIHVQGIESIWAILKRQYHGTHHQMGKRYLPLYLSEIAFRFNDRTNPNLFSRILSNGLITDRMVLNARPTGPDNDQEGQPEFRA